MVAANNRQGIVLHRKEAQVAAKKKGIGDAGDGVEGGEKMFVSAPPDWLLLVGGCSGARGGSVHLNRLRVCVCVCERHGLGCGCRPEADRLAGFPR